MLEKIIGPYKILTTINYSKYDISDYYVSIYVNVWYTNNITGKYELILSSKQWTASPSIISNEDYQNEKYKNQYNNRLQQVLDFTVSGIVNFGIYGDNGQLYPSAPDNSNQSFGGGNIQIPPTGGGEVPENVEETQFNSPPTKDLSEKKDKLKEDVKELQKKGVPSAEIGEQLWNNLVKPKMLTKRQICKKMIMMQGESGGKPISEEDAQLIVYGKVYYKDGVLYDNDTEDPSCVSSPTDDDYQPPIDEKHQMWKKVSNMIDEFKDSIIQLGIKLGEFIIAQPAAIATIAVSLTALASSAIVLPPGSGIPTALSAVQTMIKTIKDLQAKTAEILPLLAIVDVVALILPKNAQAVIAQINVIIGIYMGILVALNVILGLLDSVIGSIQKSKNKMDNQKLKIEPKSDPSVIVNIQEGAKISANPSGGAYEYKFEWTKTQTGEIIYAENPEDDDGTRIVKPTSTTTYKCKVTDAKGNTEEKLLTVGVS